MSTVSALFTRADYLRLPEGFPAELLEGCLVKEPAPTYGHQQVLNGVLARLVALVGVARALPAPVDVPIDEHNVFQPDIAVFRAPPPSGETGTVLPQVVFEVLSPGTRARDLRQKRGKYLEAGVEEVWILDPEDRTVALHTRAGAQTARGAEVLRSTVLTGFALGPDAMDW